MNYISGDILRGINERVSYYEWAHGVTVEDIRIDGDEVVIDYTLPPGRKSELTDPPIIRKGCHDKN